MLTYLTHLDGVVVSDQHSLIAELCEDSHYLADATHEFYDCIAGRKGKVLRLRK